MSTPAEDCGCEEAQRLRTERAAAIAEVYQLRAEANGLAADLVKAREERDAARAAVKIVDDNLLEARADIRGYVQALRDQHAEIERLKAALAEGAELTSAAAQLNDEQVDVLKDTLSAIDTLRTDSAALRELVVELIRYGHHDSETDGCIDPHECRSHEDGPDTCDCGFDDVFRRARAALDSRAMEAS